MNLTTLRTITAAARNIAHDGLAVVAWATASVGAIVLALNSLGVHVGTSQVGGAIAGAGAVVVLISKGIDSLNDALKGTSAAK